MGALETFDENALNYQQRFMDFSLYDDTYDVLCDLLPENANVLDVGCGPANISRYLKSKRPDLKNFGIDFAPRMIELARKNVPDGVFDVRDVRKLSEMNQCFDAIVCGFCLPYLSAAEMALLIGDSKSLLKEKGVLYLSCIEEQQSGFREEFSADRRYKTMVHYYSETDLRKTLAEKGFLIVKIFRKSYPKSGYQEKHLVIIAQDKH